MKIAGWTSEAALTSTSVLSRVNLRNKAQAISLACDFLILPPPLSLLLTFDYCERK